MLSQNPPARKNDPLIISLRRRKRNTKKNTKSISTSMTASVGTETERNVEVQTHLLRDLAYC